MSMIAYQIISIWIANEIGDIMFRKLYRKLQFLYEIRYETRHISQEM